MWDWAITSAQLHGPRPNIMRSRGSVPLISALMHMYTELRCISLLFSTVFFFVDPHPRCSDARARRQPTLVPNPRDFVRTRRDIMGIWYKFLFGRPDQPHRLFSGALSDSPWPHRPKPHVAAPSSHLTLPSAATGFSRPESRSTPTANRQMD